MCPSGLCVESSATGRIGEQDCIQIMYYAAVKLVASSQLRVTCSAWANDNQQTEQTEQTEQVTWGTDQTASE